MSRTAKITLWILGCFLAVILLLLAILPSWISTPSGTKKVVQWINSRSDHKLTIDKLHLSWLGHQRIENATWIDEAGNLVFSVHLLETETSLFYLAFGGRSFGKTVVESPYFYLTEEVATQLQKNKESKPKESHLRRARETKFPEFKKSLSIHDGTLTVSPQKFPAITISQINVDKEAGKDTFHLSALTHQGNQEGSIAADVSFGKKILAKVNVVNFPVATLDELQGSSLFTDALGPSLSLEMNVEKDGKSSLSLFGTATSANLSAYIEGKTENQTFSLSPNTQVDFTLTPALFKTLIDEKVRKDWDLASKTVMKIQVEKGVFPMTLQKPRFEDIVLQANLSIDRAEIHHQQLGSYSLKQFTGSLIALHNLEISYSGEIQGKEQTKLSGTISITPDKEVLFNTVSEGFPVSLLSLASADLEKNVRIVFGSLFNLETEGTYIDGTIDARAKVTSPLTEMDAKIEGELPELHFDAVGKTQLPPSKAKVIGKELQFSVNGNVDLTNQHPSIPFVKGHVSNAYLSLDLRGKIGEKGVPFAPESVQVIATGIIHKLPILEERGQNSLEDSTVFVQVDGSKNTIVLKGEGRGIDLAVEMNHFIQNNAFAFNKAETNFSADLQDFPLDALSPFVSDSWELAPLFGDRLNLNAKGYYTPAKEPRFMIDMKANGDGLVAALAFTLDGTLTVQQNHPSYIRWDITPERYEALMQKLRLNPTVEPTFALTRTTTLELDISQFSCPTEIPEDISHFLCQSGFIGNIRLGSSVFRNKWSNEAIVFYGVDGSIKGENFSKGIDLNLHGGIQASNVPQSEKSAFSFVGQMLNFWTSDGHFNREGLTLKGDLTLDLMPVRQITEMVPLDSDTRALVQAVLGELINAHIYGEISQLKGPITIDIKSSNFKAIFPLQLQENVILLRDFVNAEITLTPAVNEVLLGDLAPFFIAGAYSDHPLKLYIDPNGFMLPISPYNLQGVKIGKATLDIGKIRVRNGGQVQFLVDFLKAKEISHDGLMEAWFTPIYFSLQNGVISHNRFDALLAGNIHIALWGSVNMINNQVAMTLGISPNTIAQRFKVSGIGKQKMFLVKMSGTTNKLDLDWSAASTRIAFIVAKTAGGGITQLIGGLLEPLINAALGEEPVPPPTTSPLPWESR